MSSGIQDPSVFPVFQLYHVFQPSHGDRAAPVPQILHPFSWYGSWEGRQANRVSLLRAFPEALHGSFYWNSIGHAISYPYPHLQGRLADVPQLGTFLPPNTLKLCWEDMGGRWILDWLPVISAAGSVSEIPADVRSVLGLCCFRCVLLLFLELIIVSPFAYISVYLFILECHLSISFLALETSDRNCPSSCYRLDGGSF